MIPSSQREYARAGAAWRNFVTIHGVRPAHTISVFRDGRKVGECRAVDIKADAGAVEFAMRKRVLIKGEQMSDGYVTIMVHGHRFYGRSTRPVRLVATGMIRSVNGAPAFYGIAGTVKP